MIKDVLKQNESVKSNDREMAALRKHFPQCFTADGRFDMDAFRSTINDKVATTAEGYDLNFLGKNYAKLLASIDTTTVITPDTEHNSLPENKGSENIYISGDNLDALKHLLKSYAGEVKCIYIDPPYNTGTDGFVYKDKFSFTPSQLAERLGIGGEEAARLADFTNRQSASHSAWLTFMLPRLMLAKDLLADDGAIFISIDDNEQANLKLLCDYVFGEDCFVAQFPWRKRTAKSDVPFGVSQDYEWILAFARSEKFMAGIEGKKRKYYETPDFPGQPWRIHDLTTQRTANERPNSNFTIVNPKNGEEFPANPNRTWAVTADTFQKYYDDNRLIFPGDYDFLNINKPVLRYWKEEDVKKANGRFGLVSVSTQLPADVGMSQHGTQDFDELFHAKLFSYPKPVSLLKFLIDSAVEKDLEKPQIILDFFSGSATTAQAVMELNSEDDGYGLQYMLVQLPEVCDKKSDAFKAGFTTIDQIGMERIKRAATSIRERYPDTKADLGFKHYTLQEPDAKMLHTIEEFNPNDSMDAFGSPVLEKFGRDTVIATWLMRDRQGFGAKVIPVKFDTYTGYWCDRYLYLIDGNFTADDAVQLVRKYGFDMDFSPENVVLFGYSFSFSEMERLKYSLQVLEGGDKSLSFNLSIRY